MKQVWVNAATWAVTPRTTPGAELPTDTTAMPEPRSIRELPSASTSTPPPAATMKTGSVGPPPSATAAFLRLSSSVERGPGISVTRWRCWGRVGPPAGVWVMRTNVGDPKPARILRYGYERLEPWTLTGSTVRP